MFDFLRRLTRREASESDTILTGPGDGIVRVSGAELDLTALADWTNELPYPRWDGVYAWVDALPQAQRADAWLQCERTWLAWLRDTLGGTYTVHESAHALLLTPHDARSAHVTLAFIGTTLRRVERLLEELAAPDGLGKEILLLFAGEDDYYRYVAHYYPEGGTYALSAGVHIGWGCAHFAAHATELDKLEPTIVHEMTHGLLAHLPIPAWLNEGMAVNAEQRLTRIGADYWAVRELEAKHRKFWTPELIQEFWNGRSYLRTDAGNELSYDLGRIAVVALSHDWPAFKRFAAHASGDDGGAAAAHEVLGIDLGEFVRAFLGHDDGDWGPQPGRWTDAPERGAFD
ncbi:MAG TPA: hypothetical protein VFO79_09110 [Xanthomonadales bacterium]|nr:hypothetical protein [Xanthomonadales bacterium]